MRIKVILTSLLILLLLNDCKRVHLDKNEILVKANEFYEFNDYNEALELYNEYLQLDSSLGMVYYNMAYCERQISNIKSSTNNYKKAIALNYREGDANYNIAWNYAAEYNDSLALHFFKEAYKLDTTDQDILEQIEIFTHRMNR